MYKLLLYVILLLFCQCKRDHSLKEEVTDLLRTEIVIRGDKALAEDQSLKNSVCVSNLLAAKRLKSRSLLGGTAFLFLLLG